MFRTHLTPSDSPSTDDKEEEAFTDATDTAEEAETDIEEEEGLDQQPEETTTETSLEDAKLSQKDDFTLEYCSTFNQKVLTALLRKFELKSDLIGVCSGVAIQGLFAILASDLETLRSRINFIKKQTSYSLIYKNYQEALEKKLYFLSLSRHSFHEKFCEERGIIIKEPLQLRDLEETNNFLNYLKENYSEQYAELKKFYFLGLKETYQKTELAFEKTPDYQFIDFALYLQVIDLLANFSKYDALSTELTKFFAISTDEIKFERGTHGKSSTASDIKDNLTMTPEETGDPDRFYWKLVLPQNLIKQETKKINSYNSPKATSAITFIAKKSSLYTEDEMFLLLEILKTTFLEENIKTPIAFLLSSGTHLITLGLVPIKDPVKGWIIETPLVDANDFNLLFTTMDTSTLAANLITALCSKNGVALCELELFAHKQDAARVSKWFARVLTMPAIQHMHSIQSYVKIPAEDKIVQKFELKDSDGYSWISMAVLAKDKTTFKALMEQKTSLGKEGLGSEFPLTSLIAAVSWDIDVVRDLLSCRGCNEEYINRMIENETALSVALSEKNWKMAELLLDHSADITRGTDKILNEFLLDEIIFIRNKKIFDKILATEKINLNKTWVASFPLDSKSSASKRLVDFFNQYSVNPNAVNGWSFLHSSVAMGNKYMVSALLKAGANLDTGPGSLSVLDLARFLKYQEIEYLILSHSLISNEYNEALVKIIKESKMDWKQTKRLHAIFQQLTQISEQLLKRLSPITEEYKQSLKLLKQSYEAVSLAPDKAVEIIARLEKNLKKMLNPKSTEQKILVTQHFTLLPDALLRISHAHKNLTRAANDLQLLMKNKKLKRSAEYQLLASFAENIQKILIKTADTLSSNNPTLAKNLLSQIEIFLDTFHKEKIIKHPTYLSSQCLQEIDAIYKKYIKTGEHSLAIMQKTSDTLSDQSATVISKKTKFTPSS